MVVAMIGFSGQSWLGSSAELPFRNWDVPALVYLGAPRYALGGVVFMHRMAILQALLSLIMLFLLRLVFRKPLIALVVFTFVAASARWEQVPAWDVAILVLWCLIGLFTLTRYGVIACQSWLFVFFLLTVPQTASGWYFGYSLFISRMRGSFSSCTYSNTRMPARLPSTSALTSPFRKHRCRFSFSQACRALRGEINFVIVQ